MPTKVPTKKTAVKKVPAKKVPKSPEVSKPKRTPKEKFVYSDAYWISPGGKILPVDQRHITEIVTNADKFGLSREEIENVFKKFDEPVGSEANAREAIILELMNKGWIRIRYIPRQDMWTVQLAPSSFKDVSKREYIVDWIFKMIMLDNKKKYSMIQVLDTNLNRLVFTDLSDAVANSPLVENIKRNGKVIVESQNKLVPVDIKKVTFEQLVNRYL